MYVLYIDVILWGINESILFISTYWDGAKYYNYYLVGNHESLMQSL